MCCYCVANLLLNSMTKAHVSFSLVYGFEFRLWEHMLCRFEPTCVHTCEKREGKEGQAEGGGGGGWGAELLKHRARAERELVRNSSRKRAVHGAPRFRCSRHHAYI